jgi:glycine oxidase
MNNYDIAIIGNGILGYSTAYALCQKDPRLKIALIGKRNPGDSATLAAGAMLGCFSEVTKATFASTYGQAKLKIAHQASQLWPEWLGAINDSLSRETKPIKETPGTFVILNTESSKREDENYKAILKAIKLYQAEYEEVDPNLIPGLNPNHNCRPLRALFLPNENSVVPAQLMAGLEQTLKRQQNVHFYESNAKEIHTQAGKVKGVALDDNTSVNARHVVLAAGALSQDLIDKIDDIKNKIPRLLAGFGCGLLINGDFGFKNVVRTPNRSGSCGMHMVPQNATSLYIGASNSLGLSPKFAPKLRDCYYLIHRAIEQFDQDLHKVEVEKWLVGNRPVTVDAFPLIGETSIIGLWMLTGTYRDGLHASPLLAQSIANQLLGEPALFNNPFMPERAPLQTMTKEDAIAEFVIQYIGAGYEHSIALPKVGWHSMFEEISHKKVEAIYQQLNCNIGIPPDLLIMLELNPGFIPFFRDYYQAFIPNVASVEQKPSPSKLHPEEYLD